jgi:hypothetical protein
MTDGQIQGLYRGCKCPKEQIQILMQITGKSEAEICRIVGVAVPAKDRRVYAPRKEWTPKDIEHLCTAYNNGVKAKRIAEMLDRSAKAIETKIYDLKTKGVLV